MASRPGPFQSVTVERTGPDSLSELAEEAMERRRPLSLDDLEAELMRFRAWMSIILSGGFLPMAPQMDLFRL